MNREKFEAVLCHHCSPVLMGLKPSNLVSFSNTEGDSLNQLLKEYSIKLGAEDVRLEVICSCRKHEMVLVYRPQMLEEYLKDEKIRNILCEEGYPVSGTFLDLLEHLKCRFACHESFPHEIGLFLGYPLEDVIGFRQNKGSDCKLCGYWKVYGDVENARRMFARFDLCRDFMHQQLRDGYTIMQALDRKNLCKGISREISGQV